MWDSMNSPPTPPHHLYVRSDISNNAQLTEIGPGAFSGIALTAGCQLLIANTGITAIRAGAFAYASISDGAMIFTGAAQMYVPCFSLLVRAGA